MSKRVPASMRTRQSLSNVIEGRLSSPAGREELVKLATRLIIEETLEAEARDAVPVTHRRAIRTTNLLERLFVEERRRLKIIPNAFGGKRGFDRTLPRVSAFG